MDIQVGIFFFGYKNKLEFHKKKGNKRMFLNLFIFSKKHCIIIQALLTKPHLVKTGFQL